MKKHLLLFCILLLNAGAVMAQITETEPNDSLPAANAAMLNANASGTICTYGQLDGTLDYFRIITPVDGRLNLKTMVSTTYPTPPGTLSFRLFSKHNAPYNNFSAPVGLNNTAATDSFSWCCLAADTFYIEVYYGFAGPQHICMNYTFNCTITPATFGNDTEPNSEPLFPRPLAYNTTTDGHLGYRTEPVGFGPDGDDYYTIVTPKDGVVRIITETEAQSPAFYKLDVGLYNKANGILNTQLATIGDFLAPVTDTLYWPCIAKDTMHIKVGLSNFYDGGYAYRLKYDVISPVFANDAEQNNTVATAQVVNPNSNIDGHLYFYSQGDEDYFKFYKPDTGFLKVYAHAETWDTALNNITYVLKLQDKNGNDIKTIFPLIGSHSHPLFDSMFVASLPADTFCLMVGHTYYNAPCISYRLGLRSNSITGPTGIENVASTQFSLYPNPSKGSFSVKTNTTAILAVKVYDIYGKTVYAQSYKAGAGIEVQLPDAAPGIYFVEMADGTSRSTQKIVIQ